MSDLRSANSEVRIGILGSGWMGSVHAECYQRIAGAKVIDVFSRNRQRAEAAAKICGAKAIDDVSALLDDPSIDAIDVCVPTVNHEEFVLAALQRGKHVFCESPFALRLTEAEAMPETAKHSVFEEAGPPRNTFQFYSNGGAQTLMIDEHDPYEKELRYFVDSIRGNTDPGRLDAQHACEALKLSLATLQSVKENRAIRI